MLNGTDSLNNRVADFCSSVKLLYSKIKPNEKFSDFHDERTAAAILTFYSPEKYTFFMSALYKEMCRGLKIKARGINDRYEHYLSVLKLISQSINRDQSLMKDIAKETDGLIQSDLLIAQDLVFQLHTKEKNKIYTPDDIEQSQTEGKGQYSVLQDMNVIEQQEISV